MKVIAHLSDPHFGCDDRQVGAALLHDLQQMPPDLVILSGDISQRARRRQFARARDFIDALPPAPRLVVPGNHDIPLFDLATRIACPYRLYRRYICERLEPFYCDDTLAVICANSTRKSRHKHGVISKAQIEDIEKRLGELSQPFKLVALHHPLAVNQPGDRRNRARGAEQALRCWIAAGADVFLGGHIHLPYCMTVRSLRRCALVVQAGTAVSTRTRSGAANSYNLVTLHNANGRRALRCERRDYDADSGRFAAHSVQLAAAAEDGWELGEQDCGASRAVPRCEQSLSSPPADVFLWHGNATWSRRAGGPAHTGR